MSHLFPQISNSCQNFQIINLQIIYTESQNCSVDDFTTRKLRTCLPTLKSPFDKNLKSHVVYKVPCNGCSSIYVGQTSRHVTTRFSEHQKQCSSVGQHLVECCGTTHNVKWEILDACRVVEKLMTIEAIYIKKLKPQLNTRDEYRGRELTLKY